MIKKLQFTIALVAFCTMASSQEKTFDAGTNQKTYAKVNDRLYASTIEITNRQYGYFLNDLKQNKDWDKFAVAKIDSTQWINNLKFCEDYAKHYHRHPAYAEYPVVNISFEAAELYCQWLTAQTNANSKRKFEQVVFRLPTKEEWKNAARAGDSEAVYPWEGTEMQTKKGMFRCNFRRAITATAPVAGTARDNGDVTAPSLSYWPNKFGLYNMSGNVAEMLSEKGKTTGGSWGDFAAAMKIDGEGTSAKFDGPSPKIGFRCFMEIVEK